MWPSRVSGTSRQTTPEMHDRNAISNLRDVDQFIFECRVAINCFVNRCVKSYDFINTTNIMPEAIHKCSIFIE